MSTHTPGPWIWGDDDNMYSEPEYAPWRAHLDDPQRTWDENTPSHPVAIIETDSGYYGPEEADRCLIAAAPDLLAALKGILAFRRELWGDDVIDGALRLYISVDALDAADEAVAKAEGRS